MERIIRDFTHNLESLRDFKGLISPFLKEHSDKQTIEAKRQTREFIQGYIQNIVKVVDRKDFDIPDNYIELDDSDLFSLFDRVAEEVSQNPDYKDIVSQELSVGLSDTGGVRDYINKVYSLVRSLGQINMLYKSTLVTLTSTSEWYFSQTLHQYYDRFKDSAGIDGKAITFKELKSFNSIDDARQALVSEKIESLLRQNFEEWHSFLGNTLNLSLVQGNEYKDKLVEIYQRRNLVVHNGGLVNAIYMNKVNQDLRPNINIGDSIKVTSEYLDEAIDIFEIYFTLAAAEIWLRFSKHDSDRATILTNLSVERIIQGKYKVAEELSKFVKNDKYIPEARQMYGQFNYWLAIKASGRLESVRKEIESTDFSAKDPKFRLVKLAILDEFDKFFEFLPEALASKSISKIDLNGWPIFKEIREDQRIREYIC